MCDARDQKEAFSPWTRLSEDESMLRLLRETLDNLVDLPQRDGQYVEGQMVAFANCVRQRYAKELLFSMGEKFVNMALAMREDTLKGMRRRMDDVLYQRSQPKTSGDNTTSRGSPFDGSND